MTDAALATPTQQFMWSVTRCFQNYVNFSGRAARPEFWYFMLMGFVVSVILSILGLHLIGQIWSLAILLPNLAVGARRLHDTERSGLWLLLGLTLIGLIPLIIWFAQAGNPGPNRFGAGPA